MAERRVRFYEVLNEREERMTSPLPFDDLQQYVVDLSDDDAYVELDRMLVLGAAFNPGRGGPRPAVPLLTLDKITRQPGLRIERQRRFRPLALLDDESLAEPCFYALWPGNVLGVMRNSGGAPGVASFRDYVNKLGIFDENINVAPLADINALRAFMRVERLARVDLEVGPDAALSMLDDAPTIRGAVQAVRRNLGRVSVEVFIKVQAAEHEGSERLLSEMRALNQSGALAGLDEASMAFKDLDTGRMATYDFIDEAVAHSATVVLDETTNQPTEQSAAEALAEAYDKTYDDIQSSLSST